MSILIKGMEMPENCEACWNCDRNFNNGDTLITDWMCLLEMRFVNGRDRPDWCPLVPVPSHGRLIDADALIFNIGDVPYKGSVKRVLLSAPTTIPAEEGKT